MAPPPCQDRNVRPARCSVPGSWVCLHPEFAAADIAEREAALATCQRKAEAERAELRSIMRRDLDRAVADLRAERRQTEIALDEAERMARALQSAESEVASRWSTWELVGFVAGALVVGAAAGGIVAWHLTQ